MTGRRGAVLLEALVALTVLGLVGSGVVSLLAASVRAEQRVAAAEHTLEAADRVLTAMSLLDRRELDRRLGAREVGEFLAVVTRPEATLYRLSIADRALPDAELLVTVVYRPVVPGP